MSDQSMTYKEFLEQLDKLQAKQPDSEQEPDESNQVETGINAAQIVKTPVKGMMDLYKKDPNLALRANLPSFMSSDLPTPAQSPYTSKNTDQEARDEAVRRQKLRDLELQILAKQPEAQRNAEMTGKKEGPNFEKLLDPLLNEAERRTVNKGILEQGPAKSYLQKEYIIPTLSDEDKKRLYDMFKKRAESNKLKEDDENRQLLKKTDFEVV